MYHIFITCHSDQTVFVHRYWLLQQKRIHWGTTASKGRFSQFTPPPMENYSSIMATLRELKKLHLDTASSREGMSRSEKVANMVAKILSLQNPVNNIFLRVTGQWNARTQNFNKKIGEVGFCESYNAQGKGELVVGNINRFRRNLDLGKHQETWILEHAMERKCMQSEEFEISQHIRGAGGMGAMSLGKIWNKHALLSIWNLNSPFHEIQMIQHEFKQRRFGQILRSKLNNIDSMYRDTITGLYNQRYFNHIIYRHPYLFIRIQIPHLKKINETFGQGAWNHLLQITARILENSIRKNDRAVRLWWNEFFLLIDTHENSILERIIHVVQSKFYEHEGIWDYDKKLGHTWRLGLDFHTFGQGNLSKEDIV